MRDLVRSAARGARVGALAVPMFVACTRSQPVESVVPDPSTRPLPVAPVVEAPPPTKSPEGGHEICEPIVRCGVWSGCVWLERLDALRYRGKDGPEKGVVFVRRHDCWPADAGTSHCAVYCRGVDGGAPCIDALHPEGEVCTGAAMPTPRSAVCLIGAGICGSLM